MSIQHGYHRIAIEKIDQNIAAGQYAEAVEQIYNAISQFEELLLDNTEYKLNYKPRNIILFRLKINLILCFVMRRFANTI